MKVARDIQRLRSQGPTDSFGLLSCVVPWGFAVGVQGVCGGSGRAVGGQQLISDATPVTEAQTAASCGWNWILPHSLLWEVTCFVALILCCVSVSTLAKCQCNLDELHVGRSW